VKTSQAFTAFSRKGGEEGNSDFSGPRPVSGDVPHPMGSLP